MTGGIGLTSVVKDRTQIQLTARGIISETIPFSVAGTYWSATSGRVVFSPAGFRIGDVVTNISYSAGGVGATVSLLKVGLYDSSMNRLAVSADYSASMQANVVNTVALSSPYTITSEGGYLLAWVSVWSGSAPAIATTAASSQFGTAVGSGLKLGGLMTGQSDLPATLTFSANGSVPWLAAS